MSGLEFFVQSLNVDATSTAAALAGAPTGQFTADVHAEMDIDLAVVKSLFRFHTDAIDVLDASASDITYRVFYENSDFETDSTNAVLTSAWLSDVDVYENGLEEIVGGDLGNQKVPFEFVRYLAKKLFNTHLGVDLFSNEEALRNDLNSAAKTSLHNKLKELNDLTNTDESPDNTEYISAIQATGGAYEEHNHPSYAILRQIISDAPSRLADISSNLVDVAEASVSGYSEFYMPFVVGDKIFFKLTVKPATNQHDLTGVTTIADRTYKIRMNVV